MLCSTARLRRRCLLVLLSLVALTLAPLGIASPGTAAEAAYIVFSSDRNEDRYQLFRMNLDGSGVTQLTSGSSNATRPAISPDGTKIAYASGASLWVINSDGSDAEILASTYTWVESVDWSPDGSQLVYVESGGGNSDSKLHVIDADGTDDTVILRTPVLRNVEFGPDGNIVYGSATNASITGKPQLWLITADGSVKRLLRQGDLGDFALAPDGRGIVIAQTSWAGGGGPIGGVFYWDDINNLSTPNYPYTTKLWAGDGAVGNPAIAADGRVLYQHDPEFWLLETTDNDITVVNPDGSGRKKLTTGGSNDIDPDWYTGTPPPPAAPTVTITDGPVGTITQTRPTFGFATDQT
ncbi:MAG TPA: hypothetical protein VNZ66_08535, partial [Aeromicrobium sp.]|nr:hypothetical protein [Aeromicrobium sp.]